MESLGFWIFVGLFMAALILAGSREKVERQRTLQRMLERNQEIDEDLLNRLLGEQAFRKPGSAYRACRAIGAFGMVVSIPMGVIGWILSVTDDVPNTPEAALLAGVAAFLTTFFGGLGLFVSSRYCEKPDQSSEQA